MVRVLVEPTSGLGIATFAVLRRIISYSGSIARRPLPAGRSRSTRKLRLRPETRSASALRVTIVAAYCFCLVRASVRKTAQSARYKMSDPGNRRGRDLAPNGCPR